LTHRFRSRSALHGGRSLRGSPSDPRLKPKLLPVHLGSLLPAEAFRSSPFGNPLRPKPWRFSRSPDPAKAFTGPFGSPRPAEALAVRLSRNSVPAEAGRSFRPKLRADRSQPIVPVGSPLRPKPWRFPSEAPCQPKPVGLSGRILAKAGALAVHLFPKLRVGRSRSVFPAGTPCWPKPVGFPGLDSRQSRSPGGSPSEAPCRPKPIGFSGPDPRQGRSPGGSPLVVP